MFRYVLLGDQRADQWLSLDGLFLGFLSLHYYDAYFVK